MGLSHQSSTRDREEHSFFLQQECHYLLHVPNTPSDLLFLALHGYGMNARTMLDLTLLVTGKGHLVASLEAPHQFYLPDGPPNSVVGYNWGTRDHGAACIRMHHQMLRHVRQQLEERFAIDPARTILTGFSQPVGYNYRFAATFPDEVGGVIGICGGVPKDFDTGNYGMVSAHLLHIARQDDEFFPAHVTADYPRKLRTRAPDVEYHLLPGGHRFPSKGADFVQPWLQRVFGVACTTRDETRASATET